MERELFHDGLVHEGADGPSLIGKKCCACGRIIFPNGKVCPVCNGKETEDVLMGRTGKLFSFTTTYGPVAKMKPPIAVGYIETPEGVRVFAPLRIEEGKPFEIGMDMVLEVADLWEEDGVIKTGYQYRIAE